MMDWAGEFLRLHPDRVYALRRLFRCFPGDVNGVVEELRSGRRDVVWLFRHVLSRLSEDGLAPKTVSGFYMFWLKRFLVFCDVEVPDSYVLRVKLALPKRRSVRRERAPTIVEVRKMVMAAQSPQLRLLIHFLATTGLRISEALNLRWKDLELDADPPIAHVQSAKTETEREVPLTRELTEELKRIMGKDDEKIFDYNRFGATHSFAKLCERLGLRKRAGKGYDLSLHSLRRFYKTRLEEAGVNPLLIEKWMGHVSGVVHAYFKPSRKMILEEWPKAEKALTLFPEEEPMTDEAKVEEMEREITELRRILYDVLAQLNSLRDKIHGGEHP